jgi:hypothetical protein
MPALLVTVTNFGDLAVLLPIVGIIPLWPIGVRFPRRALVGRRGGVMHRQHRVANPSYS